MKNVEKFTEEEEEFVIQYLSVLIENKDKIKEEGESGDLSVDKEMKMSKLTGGRDVHDLMMEEMMRVVDEPSILLRGKHLTMLSLCIYSLETFEGDDRMPEVFGKVMRKMRRASVILNDAIDKKRKINGKMYRIKK